MDESYNALAMDYASPLIQMANLNNSWSAEQAQKQMDFQERMSSTAHQREMADLKAAGLNPVLSAKLGGASTPSGAKAEADSSLISGMATILDKVMDIALNNAEAVNDVESNGAGYNFNGLFGDGSASSVSGKSNLWQIMTGEKSLRDATDATVSTSDLGWLPLGSKALESVSNFINGFLGNKAEKKNGENTAAYAAGDKLGDIYENRKSSSTGMPNPQNIAENIKAAEEIASWFKGKGSKPSSHSNTTH